MARPSRPLRDATRCHFCGGPRHPRVHLVDPTVYGLPLRRRADLIALEGLMAPDAPRAGRELPVK